MSEERERGESERCAYLAGGLGVLLREALERDSAVSDPWDASSGFLVYGGTTFWKPNFELEMMSLLNEPESYFQQTPFVVVVRVEVPFYLKNLRPVGGSANWFSSVCLCPVANTLSSAVICTSAFGSSSYMGLISASSTCASFHDLLLVSCSCDSVPLLLMITELASNSLLVSTFSIVVCVCLSFTLLHALLYAMLFPSIDFLTYSLNGPVAHANSGI
ncbi:hypothetical protein Tco_0986985 [Tanacetum coccineum]